MYVLSWQTAFALTWTLYGSGHETVAVLLPGYAINWIQNQVTRQPQFRDLPHMGFYFRSCKAAGVINTKMAILWMPEKLTTSVHTLPSIYVSGHETVAVLLPGFVFNW